MEQDAAPPGDAHAGKPPQSAAPPSSDPIDALYANPGDGPQDTTETSVSWLDIRAHEPVLCSDGQQVGHVVEVAALPEEDIFHGVVFQHHRRGVPVLAPAADIARITEQAVHLSVEESAVAAYEPFHQLHVKSLGLRGVFHWKHLGWKDAAE